MFGQISTHGAPFLNHVTPFHSTGKKMATTSLECDFYITPCSLSHHVPQVTNVDAADHLAGVRDGLVRYSL